MSYIESFDEVAQHLKKELADIARAELEMALVDILKPSLLTDNLHEATNMNRNKALSKICNKDLYCVMPRGSGFSYITENILLPHLKYFLKEKEVPIRKGNAVIFFDEHDWRA